MRQRRNLLEILSRIAIAFVYLFASCNSNSFDGIDFYVEKSIENKSLINNLIDSISSKEYKNKTLVFSCDTSETKFININNSLCKILEKGNFREATRYNSGAIHLVYDRLLRKQNYGVYIMASASIQKDTSTRKIYYHNLVGTKYVLVAEMDW